MTQPWYERPLDRRAMFEGELGVDDLPRHRGEFLPFYVPRPVMPQIDEESYPAFLDYLYEKSLTPTSQEGVCPTTLRAHQRVSIDHAVSLSEEILAKPVLVSQDNYVLDGNHRWWGACHKPCDLNVIRLPLDFEPAIAIMFGFSGCYDIADKPERVTLA